MCTIAAMLRFHVVMAIIAVSFLGCGTDNADLCNNTALTTQTQADSPVVLNELRAKAANKAPDWIELFNKSDAEVDVGCWAIRDKSDKHTPFYIAPGTTLAPGGFLVVRRDKSGQNGFKWGLGVKGDIATLWNAAGKIADETAYDAAQAQEGNSWGRSPDGTGAFTTLLEPTDGTANSDPDPNPPPAPPEEPKS